MLLFLMEHYFLDIKFGDSEHKCAFKLKQFQV